MKKYKDYLITREGKIYRKERLLKPWDNGRGYLILKIYGKTKAVHRLVAEVWLDNPNNLPEVNHKDGDKTNNHLSNLEWCTRSKNIKHAYELELRSAKGEKNSRCKLTEEIVHNICKLIQEGFKSSEIRDMGYPYAAVRNIKRKANWRYISDLYF